MKLLSSSTLFVLCGLCLTACGSSDRFVTVKINPGLPTDSGKKFSLMEKFFSPHQFSQATSARCTQPNVYAGFTTDVGHPGTANFTGGPVSLSTVLFNSPLGDNTGSTFISSAGINLDQSISLTVPSNVPVQLAMFGTLFQSFNTDANGNCQEKPDMTADINYDLSYSLYGTITQNFSKSTSVDLPVYIAGTYDISEIGVAASAVFEKIFIPKNSISSMQNGDFGHCNVQPTDCNMYVTYGNLNGVNGIVRQNIGTLSKPPTNGSVILPSLFPLTTYVENRITHTLLGTTGKFCYDTTHAPNNIARAQGYPYPSLINGGDCVVDAPGPVSNITITPSGYGQVTLSFVPPTNSGASPVTYTILASNGGTNLTTISTSSSVQIQGLTNGTEYTFTVTPSNLGGEGTPISTQSYLPYYILVANHSGTAVYCPVDSNLTSNGRIGTCFQASASPIATGIGTPFSARTSGGYVYFPDGTSHINYCQINSANGALETCNTVTGATANPIGISFATFSSIQYAYVTGIGGLIYQCTINPTTGDFTTCTSITTGLFTLISPTGIS